METNRLNVVLLTRSLDVGGAQRQLVELAKGLVGRGHSVTVGTFYAGGALQPQLEHSGVEIVDLAKAGRWDLLMFGVRLVRELRRRAPDVVYSFLGTANMMAAAARPFLRGTAFVWSIRASNVDLSNYDWLSRLSYRLECRLSRSADAIISNSSAGAAFAVRNGFPAAKIVVIPNGIDTERFRPVAALRSAQRRSFGLREEEVAVGVLARLDPMKGYTVFLQAASALAAMSPKARFFCIGDGRDRLKLERTAEEMGLTKVVRFPGEQDASSALNALDIACSCSLWGEGFSNAIAEAMACGLPCIVTDVGDSRAIVGDCGTIVPPGSSAALAEAMQNQIENLHKHDPDTTRRRIVDHFSILIMVERTVDVLKAVATGRINVSV